MSISLYEASVASYVQTVGAVDGFLGRALQHFREHGVDPESIVETSLYPDMRPFRFQIQSVVHQSIDVIEALETGVFYPPSDLPPHDYAALQEIVRDALARLKAVKPADVDRHDHGEVAFETPRGRRMYSAPAFILSFSMPNFHFHATTAYDILRMKGVPLGKRDYMGVTRAKD